MFPLLILFLKINPGGTVRQKTVTTPGMIGAIFICCVWWWLRPEAAALWLLALPRRTKQNQNGWLFAMASPPPFPWVRQGLSLSLYLRGKSGQGATGLKELTKPGVDQLAFFHSSLSSPSTQSWSPPNVSLPNAFLALGLEGTVKVRPHLRIVL